MTGPTQITLCNPTSDDWDDFIRANCETAFATATASVLVKGPNGKPVLKKLPRMAQKNGGKGKKLVLCGAGPSLGEHWEHYLGTGGISRMPKTEVWATNSALTWLWERGAYVTHGFGIDQTEGLLNEWRNAPPVHYVLASSVDPRTAKHLVALGRPITWFHNFVGSKTEGDLYRGQDPVTKKPLAGNSWPTTVMVGDGLNSVNRALCLAQFMGFDHVTVLGADCALGHGDVMHVNGDGPEAHGATSVIMVNRRITGENNLIDGRLWHTKPDMLFSAKSLAEFAVKGWVTLVGDTLANAVLKEATRSPDGWRVYLDKVARLGRMKGVPHPGGPQAGQVPRGRNMETVLFTVRAAIREPVLDASASPVLTAPAEALV